MKVPSVVLLKFIKIAVSIGPKERVAVQDGWTAVSSVQGQTVKLLDPENVVQTRLKFKDRKKGGK